MTPKIYLAGIALPDLAIDPPVFAVSSVRARVSEALAGNPIIFEEGRPTAGTIFDLVGPPGDIMEHSLLLGLQVALGAGGTHTLDYDGTIYTVRARHEDQPVIEYSPWKDIIDLTAGDYYVIDRIKLMLMEA